MKNIIITLIFLTISFAQSNFTPQTNKPLVLMKQLDIVIQHFQDWAVDSLGVIIPDSITFTGQSIVYRAYLYDEDGKLVKTELTQGNLLLYMSAAEIQGVQTFLDNMVAKAQKLVPVPE